MPFSRSQLEADTTQFSRGEPVDKMLTVLAGRAGEADAYFSQGDEVNQTPHSSQEESLSIRRLQFSAGRLGQSDATACSLYIIRTA